MLLIDVCGSDSWAISGEGSGLVVLVYREGRGWVDAWHNAGNHGDLLSTGVGHGIQGADWKWSSSQEPPACLVAPGKD